MASVTAVNSIDVLVHVSAVSRDVIEALDYVEPIFSLLVLGAHHRWHCRTLLLAVADFPASH